MRSAKRVLLLTFATINSLLIAQPALFSFEQSTLQAFYFIWEANISGDELDSEDWVGAFKGQTCVGSKQWGGPFTDIPAMGADGNSWTSGYMQTGDIPTFRIYDASEEAIYETEVSGYLDGNMSPFDGASHIKNCQLEGYIKYLMYQLTCTQ